jgi:ribosomal protein L13
MMLIDRFDHDIIKKCAIVDRMLKYDQNKRRIMSRITVYYGTKNIQNQQNGLPIYEEFTFNEQGKIIFIGS